MEPQQPDPSDPAFTRSLLEGLVRGTRMSNQLPGDAQRDYANTFPAFQGQMQSMGQRVGGMLQVLSTSTRRRAGPPRGRPDLARCPADPMTTCLIDLTPSLISQIVC